MRRLRRFLEPLRRSVLPELVGDPETLVIDSTLLEAHCTRAKSSTRRGFEGAAWVRWGSFAVYGVKLHLLCATNRIPVSYELTAANVAEVRLVDELLGGARLEQGLARKLLGDLAYRSEKLGETLAGGGVSLVTERRPPARRKTAGGGDVLYPQTGLRDRTHAGQDALVGLATRIVAKICAYTYGCYVNRLLGRPQGWIKDLWA